MRRKIFAFFIILAIWIILAGKITGDVLILGIIASLVTSWLYSDLLFRSSNRKRKWTYYFRKLIYTLLFIPVFFYEAFISALKVSRHAFEKKPTFSPGIVKVKTTLKNITALTILANLITLTPGTLTLDFDMREKAFFIHWIDVTTVEEAETRKHVIERFEKWLEVIFR